MHLFVPLQLCTAQLKKEAWGLQEKQPITFPQKLSNMVSSYFQLVATYGSM